MQAYKLFHFSSHNNGKVKELDVTITEVRIFCMHVSILKNIFSFKNQIWLRMTCNHMCLFLYTHTHLKYALLAVP